MTNSMTPAQQDYFATQNLLTYGIHMTKKLPAVAGQAIGSMIQIPLQRMGILTGVTLHVTVPLNITAAAALSDLAPFNLVNRVSYTDFSGVQRTKTTGYALWAAQCMKVADLIGTSSYSANPDGITGIGAINTDILRADTAVGTTQLLQFSLYVPMAYDPTADLRGAVLTQTNVGEHYINLQLANALVGSDASVSPYTSGTMTTTGITVDAYQHYLQPQDMTYNNLPAISLSTIYGFEGGFQNTANISAGQSSYINYPNNRSVMSALMQYQNGGQFTLNETDISLVTLLVNSNTNFREMSPRLVREIMRHAVKGDLASSTYYMGHRRQPILTQQYANVQAKFDVLTANAGVTQFINQFEVLYPSGTPLPGIVA